MDEQQRKPFPVPDFNDPEQLLEYFLSLSPEAQDREFPPSKKVAKSLRKSERTISNWWSCGRVGGIKVGERGLRIYWASVIKYLKRIQDEGIADGSVD